MPNAVVVRSFEPADAVAVSSLIAATMRTSNAGDYPADRLEALIAYFTPGKLRLLAQERDCLVAVCGGEVMATAAREGNELATFFVHPEWQRRGVGTRLLEQLERNARKSGVGELRVDASITGACFYERHGYQRTGASLAGTAGPQITLTKRITEPLANER
ncbi:MAG: GNAT family N-acetyltransferase [Gemmatimonadota bacterium]